MTPRSNGQKTRPQSHEGTTSIAGSRPTFAVLLLALLRAAKSRTARSGPVPELTRQSGDWRSQGRNKMGIVALNGHGVRYGYNVAESLAPINE